MLTVNFGKMYLLQATLIDCVNKTEKRTQKMIDARLLGLLL